MVRLLHEVIGAHFEAKDVVNDLAASGQHDDPDPKILSQPAGEGQSVLAGQPQIEDDEIDRGLRHDPAHSRAVLRDRDPVALAGQIYLDQVADIALIVDNRSCGAWEKGDSGSSSKDIARACSETPTRPT